MNLKFKDLFFDIFVLSNHVLYEEYYKIFSFDYFYFRGYHPLTTLKKCSYNHYIQLEFDIFRTRILLSMGISKQVEYEFGLEKFRRSRERRDLE